MTQPHAETSPSASAVPADYHLHTPFCRHAEGLPSEYRAAAAARGVPEICFTDHAPAPDGYDAENRMLLEDFPKYREMLAALADGASPRVLVGIEADFYEGVLPFQSRWLPAQEFDLVLGSVHFIGEWGFDNPVHLSRWADVDVRRTWQTYFGLVARLACSGLYDVVAHLDLPKKFGHRIEERDLSEAAAPALDAIAAAGLAVELNTGGLRKPAREMYPSALLLRMARKRGIAICFGSDSHSPGEVATGFEAAVGLAREAGFTEYARFSRRQRRMVPLPPAAPDGALRRPRG